MKKHLLSSTVALTALIATAATPAEVTGFSKAGTGTRTTPLKLETKTADRGLITPLRIRKAAVSQNQAFTLKTPMSTNGMFRKASASHAGAYSMPAYGVVVYSDAWQEDNTSHVGMYEIPTFGAPQSLHMVHENMDLMGQAGCVYANGKFFSAVPDINYEQVTDMTYYIFNTETWAVESTLQGDISFLATCMTYDPTSESVFGCFINSKDQYYYFGSLDINTGNVTEIANWNVDIYFSGMAASPSGKLYGMTPDGYFCSIDKRTGATAQISSTGICSDYITSAAIDYKTGKMYYVATTDWSSELYEINTATGDISLLYNLPGSENILGLYVPMIDVEGGAPSVATAISADFSGGSLTGKVNFTAPTLNYNNIPGKGDITYTVLLNGDIAATGTTQYGASASAEVTAPAAGDYTIAVAFSNAAGQGPLATTHAYIGPDKPTAVKNVKLDYENGSFVLTWDAPGTVNGGFIDQNAVTYNIVRYPDATTVATSHKGTKFTEPVAEPESQIKYSYSVAATYEGVTTTPVMSNIYALGSFNPPYKADFSTAADLEDFTIIDANKDGKTWEWVEARQQVQITYNPTQAANDYLILPPMKLEAGNTYSLAFEVKALMESQVEKVAVFVGQSPTAEAMTTRLLAPTNVSWEEYQRRETFFVPETSGTYFFAIQGCSEANRFYLCIDNIYLSAAMNSEAPAAPVNLTVVPGEKGAYTADISFTAPTTTIAGTPLESIERVEIYRDGKLIGTRQAAPGAEVTFTDNSPHNGNNDYGVAAVNSAGKGAEAHSAVYIGVHAPVAVETLTALRNQRHSGKVNLGWDAVTTDINGNPLSTSQVKYSIYRSYLGFNEIVAEGVTGTSYTDEVCAADAKQQFVYYGITAHTEAGEGEMTLSELVTVGAPYTLPYVESYNSSAHIFGIDADELNPGEWRKGDDTLVDGVTAQDGDNGFLVYWANWTGANSVLYSGMILVEDATTPELSFYYYDYNSANEFDVRINYGAGFRTVKTVKLGASTGWTKCTISLGAYLGQEIQYAIAARLVDTTTLCFDNFRAGSRMNHNLVASAIAAPNETAAGETATVTVTVVNDGVNAAEGFEVELFRDNRSVAVKSCGYLDADSRMNVEFSDVIPAVAPDEVSYHAVIKYAADESEADNTTSAVKMRVRHPEHPVATGLKAVSNGNNVDLTWTEPDFDAVQLVSVIDGAEDYRTFSIGLPSSDLTADNVGDWTMVDLDGLTTYGIGNGNGGTYQFANANSAKSFMVFDISEVGLNNPAWNARTGSKMFVCFASEPEKGKGNDDWMISPELPGRAQTISFYAKGVAAQYVESFEVYYSTGGVDTKEFTKIGRTCTTTNSWEQFSFDLPEGAKHFAIRCVSNDQFALCIDDISYAPANAEQVELSLLGYNVYRNGVKVNAEPVEEALYTDVNAPTGEHTYHVTALYTIGESRGSNVAKVSHNSGLDSATAESVLLAAADGCIIIEGAEGLHVAIASVDGRTIYSGKPEAALKVAVAPAVYIVKAGDKTVKLAVR